jgi:hypothetical protein
MNIRIDKTSRRVGFRKFTPPSGKKLSTMIPAAKFPSLPKLPKLQVPKVPKVRFMPTTHTNKSPY